MEDTRTPHSLDPRLKQYYNITEDGVPLQYYTSGYLQDLRDFEVRASDVFVLSYPKSGTTLIQYIVTQIVQGRLTKSLLELNFYLEALQAGFVSPANYQPGSEGTYKIAEQAPSPRLMKSHLPMKYLPAQIFTKKPKMIYVARNPKDTAVSFYNFTKIVPSLPNFQDWSEFYEHYCRGLVTFGDWFAHVLPFWELQNESNVLFLKYEDIIRDLKGTVDKISHYLEKPISPEELQRISENVSFDEMKKNGNVNYDLMNNVFDSTPSLKFMRKGKVGDWRNYFTQAQNDHFDDLYRTKMADTGLEFDFGC